jgi:hypothetical protein
VSCSDVAEPLVPDGRPVWPVGCGNPKIGFVSMVYSCEQEVPVQTVGHGVAIQVGCSIIWMSLSLLSEWTDNVTDRVSVAIALPDFSECA